MFLKRKDKSIFQKLNHIHFTEGNRTTFVIKTRFKPGKNLTPGGTTFCFVLCSLDLFVLFNPNHRLNNTKQRVSSFLGVYNGTKITQSTASSTVSPLDNNIHHPSSSSSPAQTEKKSPKTKDIPPTLSLLFISPSLSHTHTNTQTQTRILFPVLPVVCLSLKLTHLIVRNLTQGVRAVIVFFAYMSIASSQPGIRAE